MSINVPYELLTSAWTDFGRRLSNLLDGLDTCSEREQLRLAVQHAHALSEELALAGGQTASPLDVMQQMCLLHEDGMRMNASTAAPQTIALEGQSSSAAFPFVDVTKFPESFTGLSEYKGKLVLVASENGGEEWALSQTVHSAVEKKSHVLLFSGAVGASNIRPRLAYIGMRLCCAISRIPFIRIEHSFLEDDEWDRYESAVKRLAEARLTIETADRFSVAEIEYKTVRTRADPPKLIIIEQSQHVIGLNARNYYMPMWVGALKCIARGMNVPILLIQPSVNVENFNLLAREVDQLVRL